MTEPELNRLERQIGRVLRIGVALSAGALALGLALFGLGFDAAAQALFTGGLVLLMAIPTARILASFVDALRRRDRLLAWATGIVLLVMVMTVVYSLTSGAGSA
jgi:uncharacterized membrane protein